MKKLALVLLLAACSKATDSTPAKPAADQTGAKDQAGAAKDPPKVIKGPTASASDPDKLPPAGTAPPAVTVSKEIPMWNAQIKTLKGADTKLADYRGKGLLIVNVASECGLTPQYEQLEAIQKKYGSKGFTVIGFPCNQFGGQEPGTAEEIQTFCSKNFGVTFPMMEKIEVNGDKRHEIYKTLTDIADDKGHKGDIRWNFEKFVVSADGTRITRFHPKTKPDDPSVIAAIEQSLPSK
jgi:glutathione peroxidase